MKNNDMFVTRYRDICLMCSEYLILDGDAFRSLHKIHNLCKNCIMCLHEYGDKKSYAPDLLTIVDPHSEIDLDPDNFYMDPNHVTDNIYIGSILSSTSLCGMKKFGITHVATIGEELSCKYPDDFIYHKRVVYDSPKENVQKLFDETTTFIHNASLNKDNKILVHCVAGISRSATFVIAYLIRYKKMSPQEAYLLLLKARKCVCPNEGFTKQLVKYYELQSQSQ